MSNICHLFVLSSFPQMEKCMGWFCVGFYFYDACVHACIYRHHTAKYRYIDIYCYAFVIQSKVILFLLTERWWGFQWSSVIHVKLLKPQRMNFSILKFRHIFPSLTPHCIKQTLNGWKKGTWETARQETEKWSLLKQILNAFITMKNNNGRQSVHDVNTFNAILILLLLQVSQIVMATKQGEGGTKITALIWYLSFIYSTFVSQLMHNKQSS